VVTRTPLRVVFFGTPDFAVPTLEQLIASSHQVVAVVTQPDRPRGRGLRSTPPPARQVAERHAIPVFQPERLKDEAFLGSLAAERPDCGVVAAYGRIPPAAVLALPRLGLLNVHASLLPRYRGAAPIERAIMAGDRETGITIMRVVQALDAGPMLAAQSRPIDADETSVTVEEDLARLGARLLLDVLNRLDAGVPETPQDDSLATYAPRITREDGAIDWTRPARAIHDQVRALHPWPHAFTFLDGERFIILTTRIVDEPAGAMHPAGWIARASGETLRVTTGDRPLDVARIQPEGRRPMLTREFLAGHHVEPGAVFGAPA
jgi:methionyl-tRNA formyltransferase